MFSLTMLQCHPSRTHPKNARLHKRPSPLMTLWPKPTRCWLAPTRTYGNGAAAEREFRRALELDPNNGNAHHWYGIYLGAMGRHEEALTHIKRALEVDPLNLTFNTTLASSYADATQYDLALDQFKKTIEIDPNYASAHDNLARTYRDM